MAFFALQTLPVRSAGILFILFAILMFILEVKVTSYGVLTIGGVVSMFLGGIMLFEQTPGFTFQVDWRVALAVRLFWRGRGAPATRGQKAATGREWARRSPPTLMMASMSAVYCS